MPLKLTRNLLLVFATACVQMTFALAGAKTSRPILRTMRQAPDDLEIRGMIDGLGAGRSAWITRQDLLALPQTRAVVTDNPDYPGPPMHVSGVSLELLSRVVHPLAGADLIDALCADRYRSPFPYEYIAQHHPILVLTIDGKPLAKWAAETHHFNPSPYVVMYSNFKPSFRVLSHEDRAQLPDNLLRLNWTTQAATFDPIKPRGNFGANSPEQTGFVIAKQNCLRCHYQGATGGTKSGLSWGQISIWAREQPKYFQAYIHNPKAIDPRSHMEAQTEYDRATLEALTAYFRTFSSSPGGAGK